MMLFLGLLDVGQQRPLRAARAVGIALGGDHGHVLEVDFRGEEAARTIRESEGECAAEHAAVDRVGGNRCESEPLAAGAVDPIPQSRVQEVCGRSREDPTIALGPVDPGSQLHGPVRGLQDHPLLTDTAQFLALDQLGGEFEALCVAGNGHRGLGEATVSSSSSPARIPLIEATSTRQAASTTNARSRTRSPVSGSVHGTIASSSS